MKYLFAIFILINYWLILLLILLMGCTSSHQINLETSKNTFNELIKIKIQQTSPDWIKMFTRLKENLAICLDYITVQTLKSLS